MDVGKAKAESKDMLVKTASVHTRYSNLKINTMAVNRNATKGGMIMAMALEPEYPAWVRRFRSSPRRLMAVTWRREAVVVY